MSLKAEWSFSEVNQGLWYRSSYPTRQEAEKEAIEYAKEEGLAKIAIEKLELIPLPSYIDPEDILEKLHEYYEDEAGAEYDNGYLYAEVEKEHLEWLEEKLKEVINAFHRRAGIKPEWFRVTNTYELNVNEGSKEELKTLKWNNAIECGKVMCTKFPFEGQIIETYGPREVIFCDTYSAPFVLNGQVYFLAYNPLNNYWHTMQYPREMYQGGDTCTLSWFPPTWAHL